MEMPAFFARLRAWHRVQKSREAVSPFFRGARGVIHVGAHHGEEILRYASAGLRVVWIEANPACMKKLRKNLSGFVRQRAIQALIGGKASPQRAFFLASNDGASSSVFPIAEHQYIWPDIKMYGKVFLPQQTLPETLLKEGIAVSDYDTLVLDVQGAELEVLHGIPALRQTFEKIELEAADFPSYEGGTTRAQIHAYLVKEGFEELEAIKFASDNQQRNYFTCRYLRSR